VASGMQLREGLNTVERLERAGEMLSLDVRAAILALEEENHRLRRELAHAVGNRSEEEAGATLSGSESA
jgi:hypothetical protein